MVCMSTPTEAAASFDRLYSIVARLRSPTGCPWDREQSPESLRGSLIEETYECVEAIDEKDPLHIREELGDIFLLATMVAYMHEQEGKFRVSDALEDISNKLVRRHPHVFGESDAKTSSEAVDQWVKIKVELEGKKPKDSILDEVSRALPPLDRAYKLQKKAAKVGFDWPDIHGVWAKIEEEFQEAKEACALVEGATVDAATSRSQDEVENELGDLLFSVVNLCRYLKVEPSVALQRTNSKFVRRFAHVEKSMKQAGIPMETGKLEIMDTFWDQAKELELDKAVPNAT
jgi:tetrapyrrole methylase family protein/MazG family protein